MPSEQEGNDAIQGLNNKEVEGRAMSVSVAKEKPKSNSGGFNRGGGGGYSNSRKW
jgi:hypothetical protein